MAMAFLKIPKFGLKHVLSSPPYRYWNGFLFELLVVMILVLAFDAWVFWRFSFGGALGQAVLAPDEAETVRRDTLSRVFEKIKAKKEAFEKYKGGAGVEDP